MGISHLGMTGPLNHTDTTLDLPLPATTPDHPTEPSSTTTALARYITTIEPPYPPITERRLAFETSRPRLLRQCLAEATGTFFFVYTGLASVASYILHTDSEIGATAFGSHFQTGCAFGLGVVFAVITCAPTSGGHFNPAVTISLAFWQGFPWWKVPLYILSQVAGSFMGGLLVMGAYWPQIQSLNAKFLEAGRPLFGSGTPASILCAFPGEGQENPGYVFLVEFLVDVFIGIVIWATLDPANQFIAPSCIPPVLGAAYASMIWGFGSLALSTNLARDLGTRMVAAMFYGREAFTYMGYAPIAMLVNIPATLLATAYYELVMRDSLSIIGRGRAKHEGGDAALYKHLRTMRLVDEEKGGRSLDATVVKS
ncbi:related to Putative channel protein, exgression is glucose repressed by Mig1 and Mig2 [Cephalotrichum gorgonifer]|uniref:Related to Putative channel protein, exgression is glucose repressed by Mig1 and Mig2 n=1 Tax=Cephalotrichum gorgonifer TaxID=2041049 RepID=A0AAE8SZ08_9PEZI|nr:related to Putative channel protein, exgression is glucose repressed by Mig1 and Mig2 [Cephalotrichum gorgonifer]